MQLALTTSGGNGTITVLWSVEPAEGSFNNPAAQNPIWTAATPSADTAYEISVEVRDEDDDIDTDSVVITVSADISDVAVSLWDSQRLFEQHAGRDMAGDDGCRPR